MAKVTLLQNSDHLACHLTCTFMFAPCPENLYGAARSRPLLISRSRFQIELRLAQGVIRPFGTHMETFEKHMASKAQRQSEVFRLLTYRGQAELMPFPFWFSVQRQIVIHWIKKCFKLFYACIVTHWYCVILLGDDAPLWFVFCYILCIS